MTRMRSLLLAQLAVLLADALATPRAVVTAERRALSRLPARCQPSRRADPDVGICRLTFFEKRPWLLLWGDSHALQYLEPLRDLARERIRR